MSMKKKIIKKNISNKETQNIESNELKKLAFLVIIVLAVFLAFYGITCLILNKNDEEIIIPTEIQYDEILLTKLLEQGEKSYYVLVTTENDSNKNLYNTYKTNYYKLEKHDKIYDSNLSNIFNKAFLSDKTNTKIKNINELKLSQSILIKIDNKKISKVYDGSDAIIEQFKNMNK